MATLPPARRAEAVALLFALIALALLVLPDPTQRSLARSTNHVILFPVAQVRGVFGGYLRLRAENAALKRDLQAARIALTDTEAIRLQNRELSRMLGFVTDLPVRLIPARVISRDFGALPSTLLIDVGRGSGVQSNLPIVTDRGLVGKVVSVGPRTSEVMLYTHPDFSASALLIGGEQLEYGIVRPDPSGLLRLLLPLRARSDAGDRIVTSGYGATFPRGIPIGTVVGTEEDQRLGLQRIDRVDPAVDLGGVTAVFVLMHAVPDGESAGDELRLFWPGYAHPPMAGERLGSAGRQSPSDSIGGEPGPE